MLTFFKMKYIGNGKRQKKKNKQNRMNVTHQGEYNYLLILAHTRAGEMPGAKLTEARK